MRNHPIDRGARALARSAVVLALLLAASGSAWADSPKEPDEVALAREAFLKGTELVKSTQWAEALVSFEKAAKLRPHAITTSNIAVCERALGRYTRARKTLRRALAENEASGGTQLPEGVLADNKAYLTQIEGLLATASITLDPANAAIGIDGRPLEVESSTGVPVLVSGLRAPGPGEAPPAATFKVVLDPGTHVLTLSRKGFADAIVNKTFGPGSVTTLTLSLDKLPATFHVGCDQPGAIVSVNGLDVGMAPVDVSRPAGKYRVIVKKPGHVTYEAEVNAQAGESVDLKATLPEEKRSLTSQWWFWTGSAVLLSGVAISTYFLTRKDPDPVRPALNGGSLGWTVPVP